MDGADREAAGAVRRQDDRPRDGPADQILPATSSTRLFNPCSLGLKSHPLMERATFARLVPPPCHLIDTDGHTSFCCFEYNVVLAMSARPCEEVLADQRRKHSEARAALGEVDPVQDPFLAEAAVAAAKSAAVNSEVKLGVEAGAYTRPLFQLHLSHF